MANANAGKLSGVSSRGDMQRKPPSVAASFLPGHNQVAAKSGGDYEFETTSRNYGSHPAPEERTEPLDWG
jgi:hypothetical protein